MCALCWQVCVELNPAAGTARQQSQLRPSRLCSTEGSSDKHSRAGVADRALLVSRAVHCLLPDVLPDQVQVPCFKGAPAGVTPQVRLPSAVLQCAQSNLEEVHLRRTLVFLVCALPDPTLRFPTPPMVATARRWR